MKMEELDLEQDVRDVVTQEATAIVDVLCMQRTSVLQQIYGLMDVQAREQVQNLPNCRETVSGVVDYFRNADQHTCRHFLDTIWGFCENIPLELEIRILFVAGSSAEGALANNSHMPDLEKSPRSRTAKRACLDQVQRYINAVKHFLQKKFEKVTKDMKKKVCLDQTWLCWRTQKYARARDRHARAQEGEEVSTERKESVEALLKKTGRVVMLSGQAGSGKTLLMHCLGHHWAQGSYPSIELLFLLEFRQLNLVSQPLSLQELLFSFFLPSEEDSEQSEAVLSYVLSNPEKICFIFDGYDEFAARFTDPKELVGDVNHYQKLPLADLLSALCSSKILPGCTVLVTCRPRDAFDLFGSSDYCVAELLGFNQQRVKEYTEEYFHEKGSDIKERAVSLLMNSHHLLSMSHVPGLCHVCCVCLEHFLSKDMSQEPGPQLPTSLTQIYLHILSAFISRGQGCGSSDNHTTLLEGYRVQINTLSKLAMNGLEKSQIVFPAKDLPTEIMNFGANAGILSRVDLTCADGSRCLGCAFTHLTMQEFMAALHLMTSPDITETKLKQKLNLKSRWTAKTDPKSVFTDSLHLYMCGLAAEACTLNLVLLKGTENAKTIVLKRQEAVLKILQHFVVSGRQTGPKIIELCRCAHETQNLDLAKAVGSRDRFELRNIRLNPVDIDALAFVTSSANQMVCLDFGACSIEPECLNLLLNCKNLETLIFRSRKYDDKFAVALSGILPKLQSLRQLEFISAGLGNIGAAKLFKALECCPQIAHLNVSDNYLSDESIRKITEMIPKLTNLTSVKLGKNSISKNGIFVLIEKMAALLNIKKIYANAKKKETNVLFCPRSPNTNTEDFNNTGEAKEVILTDWSLKCGNVSSLCRMLKGCSSLTVLNLSSNSLGNSGLKKLLEQLPSFDTLQEINVSDNEVDMDGVVLLSNYLCTHKDLSEVNISHNGKRKLVLKFSTSGSGALKHQTPDGCYILQKFSLTECDIPPTYMNKLCKNLSRCQNQLDLDLSHGTLIDESIGKLLRFLPEMESLRLLNLSDIKMSTDSALLLVQLLSDCQRTAAVELRPLGKAFIKFLQTKSDAATCKLNHYKLSSANLAKLCGILEHCHHLTDLDLSSNFLQDEDVKTFVQFLPKLKISSSVSLNNNCLTEDGVIYLLSLMNTCERVAAIEVSLGNEVQQTLIRFDQKNFAGKSFSLSHCCFDLKHLRGLVDRLTSCPKLTLQLTSCTVQSQNLHFLLNNLATLNSIQTLELRTNSFNAEVVKHLVTELCKDANHRIIRIMEPWIKGEAAVDLVADCLELNPHIKEIRVEKTCLNLSVESLNSATAPKENGNVPLISVDSISFNDCEVEGLHLSSLQSTVQKCLSLQKLQFSQLTMGADGAEFLSSVLPLLDNLKILSLNSTGETDEVVVNALQHTHKHLERLSLFNHVIKDSGAAVLGKALQALTRMRSFSLLQCLDCTAAGGRELVSGLVHCRSLEEIRLESLELDEESAACFAQGLQRMMSLKNISLKQITSRDSSGILCVLASLHSLTEVEELELLRLRMGDRGIDELVKHIPKLTKLKKINLSENCVSDHAGEVLVKALSHCRALQQICLSKNNLGHSFAAVLGQVLPSFSELSELDLSENQIGSEGCSSLCKGLVSMKALKKLHLTSIKTSDLVSVASCLEHCSSLEDVSLAWNNCENDVVLKLAEVLPQCSKLKRLDLEANNINTSGAKTLVTCLRLCPWIEVIRLWRNPIKKNDPILKDERLNFSST